MDKKSFMDAVFDWCMEQDELLHSKIESEERAAFEEEYIHPLIGERTEEAEKMEQMLEDLVVRHYKDGFKRGFRACIEGVMNCLGDK